MLSASKSGSPASTGYNLTRSLRFRASASSYLSKTNASAGNQTIWTWSCWLKRGLIGSSTNTILGASAGGLPNFEMRITGDQFDIYDNTGSIAWRLYTNQVFRDPSAWYHFVFAYNSPQATAANRLSLYVNGVQVTSFQTATYPAQNGTTIFNGTVPQAIGASRTGSYSDAYLTEVNFIDGQALTPSSFGSTNALTGVWQPARYTGTYGTNGFYLPFTDNSALTTSSNVGLGKDFSGNGNYWTTNNISITAGVTYDSMTDVPTLTSATASNFAVLNPLDCDDLTTGSVYNSNLAWAGVYAGKNGHPIRSTFRTPPSGKWYVEARNVTYSGGGNSLPIGFTYSTQAITSASVFASTIDSFIGVDATVFSNAVTFRTNGVSASLAAYTTLFSSCSSGDVINFAIDLNAGKFWIGKNGTWYNSGDPAAGTNATSTFTVGSGNWTFLAEYVSAGDNGNRSSAVLNFGQQPFTLTPPSGFLAMNTYNLPTSTIVKGNTVMDATLYTGTGAAQSIVNAAAFKPDLVWIKCRSAAQDHNLYDSVRGVNNYLTSDTTAAAVAVTQGLSSFATNGFSVGTGSDAAVNTLGQTYVGWQWLKSASAGFDIVTFTGNGGGQTFAHNLGVAPGLMICKSRNNAQDWYVYHSSIGGTGALSLNTTAATATSVSYWSNVTPSSSTFSVGGNFSSGYTYVNYLFAPIAGFSAFGSYVGNGVSAGPFVYCGFQPKFILIKSTTAARSWCMWDTSRNPYNLGTSGTLFAESSSAEYSGGGAYVVAVTSNGFYLPVSTSNLNGTGETMVYAAFASNPFKNSLAF